MRFAKALSSLQRPEPNLPRGISSTRARRCRALFEWSQRTGVALRFIEPGKPIQNAFAESFISRFRDECLNENWLVSLADARLAIETWRRHCNEARPHSALGYEPPATFAAKRWGRTLRVIGHSAPRPIARGADAMIPMKPLTF